MQTWSAGYYEQIVQYLHDAGIYVGAVNPTLIKDYGFRNTLRHVKTDKADAMPVHCLSTYCVFAGSRPYSFDTF